MATNASKLSNHWTLYHVPVAPNGVLVLHVNPSDDVAMNGCTAAPPWEMATNVFTGVDHATAIQFFTGTTDDRVVHVMPSLDVKCAAEFVATTTARLSTGLHAIPVQFWYDPDLAVHVIPSDDVWINSVLVFALFVLTATYSPRSSIHMTR